MNLDGFLGNCFLIFQEHKVLLTGTPLQNTVEELFSLLHFLEPGRFPSETTFMQEFGDLKTEEQVICSRTLTSLFTYCEFNHFAISELYYLLLQVIPVFLLRSPELIYPYFFLVFFFLILTPLTESQFALSFCFFVNWSCRNMFYVLLWASVAEWGDCNFCEVNTQEFYKCFLCKWERIWKKQPNGGRFFFDWLKNGFLKLPNERNE